MAIQSTLLPSNTWTNISNLFTLTEGDSVTLSCHNSQGVYVSPGEGAGGVDEPTTTSNSLVIGQPSPVYHLAVGSDVLWAKGKIGSATLAVTPYVG